MDAIKHSYIALPSTQIPWRDSIYKEFNYVDNSLYVCPICVKRIEDSESITFLHQSSYPIKLVVHIMCAKQILPIPFEDLDKND